MNEAIILAGGLGTRLRSQVADLPKCMAPVNKRPFLTYVLDYLIQQGMTRIILSVGYKAAAVMDYFGDSYHNCSLVYAPEESPLGTGGAIKNALQYARGEDMAVLNGDSVFFDDLQAQYRHHISSGAETTLALKRMQNIERYGTVDLNKYNRIVRFREKQFVKEGLVNTGVYICNVSHFREKNFPEKFSLEKDYFEALVDQLHFSGFIGDGYFLDIGIPEDYKRAQYELKV